MAFMQKKYLGDIAQIISGLSLREKPEFDEKGEIFLLRVSDVSRSWVFHSKESIQRIRVHAKKESEFLKAGDVVFFGRGARPFAVLLESIPDKTLPSPYLWVLRLRSNEVKGEYLAWFLTHSQAAKRYYLRANQGSALTNIPKPALASLPVWIPPLVKQALWPKLQGALMKEKQLMDRLAGCRQALMDTHFEGTANSSNLEANINE
jgi:restriction endonuclease S subunit